MLLKVGDKVRIKTWVPISNQELAPGRIGTVTELEVDEAQVKPYQAAALRRVVVKLDDHIECLDEWDNEIHFDLGNWCEEKSVEQLVMHALEILPSVNTNLPEHPLVKAARERWSEYLLDKLNETYAAWRREAGRDFDSAELTKIAMQVHKDYMDDAEESLKPGAKQVGTLPTKS